MKEQDKVKQFISGLNSGNPDVIKDTLSEVRKIGKIGVLPEVIHLLHLSMNNEIIDACTSLLNDIKDKEARVYMVDAIKDTKYKNILSILISSCWQSGLDYSDYLLEFTEAFLKSDYAVSIEAFTVIEESVPQCSDSDRNKALEMLESHAEVQTEDKAILQELLIKTIQSS